MIMSGAIINRAHALEIAPVNIVLAIDMSSDLGGVTMLGSKVIFAVVKNSFV